jgi:uncharacterized protein (DUF1330 family)
MYLDATDENGRLVFGTGLAGPVTMLNLLRFADVADYSNNPELAPAEPISGMAAYDIYMAKALPFVEEAGAGVTFLGTGGHYLIGPTDVRWDGVMLVHYPDVGDFLAMATNEGYLATLGHRTAALADSRLLPIVEG